jgi:hypothetical protein
MKRLVTPLILIALLLFFVVIIMRNCRTPTQQAAKKYHVKAGGNDSRTGLSDAEAWATIGKVNSMQSSLVAGDSIVFRGGDTFTGTLKPAKSGSSSAFIYYGSYGTGKAVFSGLKTITGWVNLGSNIWEAPTSGVKADNNLVLRNGIIQQVGRYPNKDADKEGWLNFTSASTTSLTGPAQSSATNWKGAEVAIRPNRWEIVRRPVKTHSGGTITYDALRVTPRSGYGYFFQRDARTLDRDGEWFQNGTSNKLRMYFGNNNPNAYTIQASTIDTLIYTNRSYLVFENLVFTGANDEGIMCEGGSNIKILRCEASKMGRGGFSTWFVNTVTVTDCQLTDCLSHGIRVHPTSVVTTEVGVNVNDNIVRNTALFAGMEVSDISSGGNAILVRGGSGVNCLRNIITNSGYGAINWLGDNVQVKYNYIDSFCRVRDDGGGIYIYQQRGGVVNSKNRNIVGNTILNGFGNGNGTSGGQNESSVVGVYVDEGVRDVVIDSNTISGVRGNGVHGNNNGNITITHNNIFNCVTSVSFQRLAEGDPIRGMRITGNTMYPYRFRYRNLAINLPTLITKEQDLVDFGVLDNNYYSTKAGIDTSISTVTQWNPASNYDEKYYGFSYLKGLPQEKISENVPNDGELVYNETSQPKTINFPGLSKNDVKGNTYDNSVTLPPYKSLILLDNGTTEPPGEGCSTIRIEVGPCDSVIIIRRNTTTHGDKNRKPEP